MDTATDFLFLNEESVLKINPYQDGEYLVIQNACCKKGLLVHHRTFNYQQAIVSRHLENLAYDYATFALRIFHEQKLWIVDDLGQPCKISGQQDWKVAQEYLEADRDENMPGEIVACFCSYIYFWSLATCTNNNGEVVEYWQPITCLIEDRGREIDSCPNCQSALIDNDDNGSYSEPDNFYKQITQPTVCIGCANYHGQDYAGNVLICAIHPYAWDGASCPDFAKNDNKPDNIIK